MLRSNGRLAEQANGYILESAFLQLIESITKSQ